MYRPILGLFLKLKKFMVPMKPSELFCFKDAKNLLGYYYFS